MVSRASKGEGITEFGAVEFAVKLSLLPNSNCHDGPPLYSTECKFKTKTNQLFWWKESNKGLTKSTASRAAMVRMSAQETVWGLDDSTAVLAASITSYPLTELLFGPAVFSPVNVVATLKCKHTKKRLSSLIFLQCFI